MDFETAAKVVLTLKKKPSKDEQLELYSLYKQATVGDCKEAAPSRINLVAHAKHQAWAGRSGMSQEDAKAEYIKVVERLIEQYGVESA